MSKRLQCTSVLMLAALLFFPRVGNAGLIDFIIEMSGPQMIGLLAECRVSTDGDLDACTIVGKHVAGPLSPPTRKLWLSLEGGVYFSTGHDTNGQNYEAFKTWMLAFDPMIEIQTVSKPNFAMYHGVMGVSMNMLFGEFRRFPNIGFKLRPIGVIIGNRVNVSYNLRLYSNGFSADEFGHIPVPTTENKPEAVHSITAGFRF